ncbi:hypothetical protein DdX_12559 [Ditylenchus destructor]|uniref:Uncharacterized protein n=1 Tax=Ditylenchus destructor TaxID=166010 RepID=A0AAD4QX84_9BILA|nr:hypothetical protein DdX_12559 [Ditylenchus destructor]
MERISGYLSQRQSTANTWEYLTALKALDCQQSKCPKPVRSLPHSPATQKNNGDYGTFRKVHFITTEERSRDMIATGTPKSTQRPNNRPSDDDQPRSSSNARSIQPEVSQGQVRLAGR